MEWQWLSSFIKFCKVFGSYIVAVARLLVWTCIFFFSGLQRTLFMRSEVAGVDLKVVPLRSDLKDTDEKLAYIYKLCLENPDLVDVVEEDFYGDKDDDFPFDDFGEGDKF